VSTLSPVSAEVWNARAARHLLNRAGFGIPAGRVGALVALSPEQAVASLLDYDPGAHPERRGFILSPLARGDIKKMHPEADFAALQLLYQERQREEREAISALQAWWLARMYSTPNPLEEKLTLFWHGHFATSAQKVKSSYQNHQLYEIFRRNAVGNFKTLTTCVGQSPAMLEYLDNKKSTVEQPNENWARELMELFTLGQGQYTEDDIKESARAFTGWSCDRLAFRYAEGRHDAGTKTFLGRTGNFQGWDVLDIIFEQPAAATFITGKLWAFFAGVPGEKAVVEELAQTLRDNNYELRPMLRQLFLSEAFYSDSVQGAQVKSPAQFALQLCHDLGVNAPPFPALTRAVRVLGQDLFYPPNVKGWDGNRAWINANSLLIRTNLPATLLNPDGPGAPTDDDTMMGAMLPAPKGGKGGNMMAGMADAAPSTEERKAYFRVAREQAMEKIRALPKDQRAAKVETLRNGTLPERAAMLKELGVDPPPWRAASPAALFDAMTFTTAGDCIAQLSDRFLTVSPGAAQRQGLLEVMGAADESAALTAASLDDTKRLALLRLVTSMAEYQLC
jgi:hypothetical protein